jgi:hypothetical protein
MSSFWPPVDTPVVGTARLITTSYWCGFTLPIEGYPYTRMTGLTAAAAKPGSQIARYLAWKKAVQDLFEQGRHFGPEAGMPFTEPLQVLAQFQASEGYGSRDLDNLLKGIVDALNPVHLPSWHRLRPAPWLDDRQVCSVAAHITPTLKEANLRVSYRPLFAREAPTQSVLERPEVFREFSGQPDAQGVLEVSNDQNPVAVYVRLPQVVPWRSLEPAPRRLYLWGKHDARGIYPAFLTRVEAAWYALAHEGRGTSPEAVFKVLGTFAPGELDACYRTSGLHGLPKPLLRLGDALRIQAERAARFAPGPFEHGAVELTRVTGQPWGQVRTWLLQQEVDWTKAPAPGAIVAHFASKVPRWVSPKVSSRRRARRRP